MKNIGLTFFALFLTGCQSVYTNNQILRGENLKIFEQGISHSEKKEINDWTSSEFTNRYIKSKNFNGRKPTMLVLHHTDSNDDDFAINIFKEKGVSSHYLISRTGEIIQFVDEKNRSFHSGASYWNGINDVNSASIGIELSNDMNTEYTPKQIQSLITLSKDIMNRYSIKKNMVVGHLDVSPGRKIDPYINFPWEKLAKEDIVFWCDKDYKEVHLPSGFNWKSALTELGYNPNLFDKSLLSFRIKYFQKEPSQKLQILTTDEKKYMYCLLEKMNPKS